MSLMRRRAAGAAAAIVLLGFAAQPTLRWVVACAMTRALQSSVLIQGNADGSFRDQTLTLHRLQIERENRPSIEIERVSALIQPWELVRRNLVVERAFADGVAIRCGPLETRFHAPPHADTLLPVPVFDSERFLALSVGSLQRAIDDAHSHRAQHQSELEARMSLFDQRQQQRLVSHVNHSHTRADSEGLRQEYAAIRQKIAEERIAIREAIQKTRTEIDTHLASLPTRLHRAIAETLPNFEVSLQAAMVETLRRMLEEVDPFLQASMECMAPVSRPVDLSRGFDVAIPGLESHCTWVRSAQLKGWLYPSGNHRIPFECRLSHWGDIASDVAAPSAQWKFHFPKQQGEMEINHLRRATQAGGTPVLQSHIRRFGEGKQARDRVELTLEFRSHRCQLALDAPLELASFANAGTTGEDSSGVGLAGSPREATASQAVNAIWLECLSREVMPLQGEGQARIRLLGNNLPIMNQRPHPSPQDLRLDPRTLFEMEPKWSRAQRRYVAQTMRATLPSLAASESEWFEASWRSVEQATQQHLAVLEQVERSLDRWKTHWESGPTDTSRVARKP
jgi:hypothetical protein